MNKKIRELNRNAFDERLIHRYLLEFYNFNKAKERNTLLPEIFHSYDLNVVIPEAKGKEGYRPDLGCYFFSKTDHQEINSLEIPIEVKWRADELKEENQIKFLINHKGFCVSFTDPTAEQLKLKIPFLKIDENDFMNWLTWNVTNLIDDAMRYRIRGSRSSDPQHWVIVLRGEAIKNFLHMKANYQKYGTNHFWACRQDPNALKHILQMRKGDKCLFLLLKSKDAQHFFSDPKREFNLKEWHIGTIQKPYYVCLDNDQGIMFEKKNEQNEEGKIPMNKRKWPHFFNFSIDKNQSLVFKKPVSFGKREKFGSYFAESIHTGGGSPVPLPINLWNELIDRIHETSINKHRDSISQ